MDAGFVDAIASAYREARTRWPDVFVDEAHFAAELRRRMGATATDPTATLVDVHAADVYLAIACLGGDPAAVAHLERDYLREVDFAARTLGAPDAIADDVRGHLRRVLFTAEPEREAALAAFAGRAALKGYLRVIATRELVRVLNRGKREQPLEPLLERLDLDLAHAVELTPLRARHGGDITAALRAALDALDERARALLRYSLVDGWTVDRIGEVYRVHRATAARWVAAAREELAARLRREVAARLAISEDEVDSIVREVRSQIDISLARIL